MPFSHSHQTAIRQILALPCIIYPNTAFWAWITSLASAFLLLSTSAITSHNLEATLMIRKLFFYFLFSFFLPGFILMQPSPFAAAQSAHQHSPDAASLTPPPSVEYGELFREIQTQRLFPDSKTFPDMTPDESPQQLLIRYRQEKRQPGFSLHAFVAQHFAPPARILKEHMLVSNIKPNEQEHTQLYTHLNNLWKVLRHSPDNAFVRYTSLLPLPYPYAVPDGRFDELYYWDSYFIMLGLQETGQHQLAADIVKNFAILLERYGHVPNANRSYYLSRSEPPFFSLIVDLVAQHEGEKIYTDYLPALEKEYKYWMDGAESLKKGEAYRRVVRLPNGAVLNRFWDDQAIPRDEAYFEDLETVAKSSRLATDIYRNLRAACESGWDFSSRWLTDDKNLSSIHTTALLPIDLNALIFHLEQTLAKANHMAGNAARAKYFELLAARRQALVQTLLWDSKQGIFTDYNWQQGQLTQRLTAATLYPLFLKLATPAQAHQVARNVERTLLKSGGIVTTPVHSGQQWDAPNGWAPLQWVAITGLNHYGENPLAQTIAERWINKNIWVYKQTGQLFEKYDVEEERAAEGGEYPLQAGFGWTNSVLIKLMAMYPNAVEPSLRHSLR